MIKRRWKDKTEPEKMETITKGVKWALGTIAVLGVGYLFGRVTTFKEMAPLLDDGKVDRYLGMSDDENDDMEED